MPVRYSQRRYTHGAICHAAQQASLTTSSLVRTSLVIVSSVHEHSQEHRSVGSATTDMTDSRATMTYQELDVTVRCRKFDQGLSAFVICCMNVGLNFGWAAVLRQKSDRSHNLVVR